MFVCLVVSNDENSFTDRVVLCSIDLNNRAEIYFDSFYDVTCEVEKNTLYIFKPHVSVQFENGPHFILIMVEKHWIRQRV